MTKPKMVPDPYRPGRFVQETMADVYPSERLTVAVQRQLEAKTEAAREKMATDRKALGIDLAAVGR